MAGITLEVAEAKLELWLTAEGKVANGQSYSINNRSLTRADLKEIRATIDYWDGKVNKLQRGGGIRITGGTPL
ncbi:MAG: hypothetical protein KAI40_03340 [Desulfobacterales bacterium]|nr:hypothetical protein [Desulfobacterales bacterium]